MRVAIIGCGFIGAKRANSLVGCQLVFCVDSQLEKARALAQQFPGCIAESNWRKIIDSPNIDVVIIATIHNVLAEIALAAIAAKKHVFVEKPGGCNSRELQELIEAKNNNSVSVGVGFNHRFHRAFIKAKELINTSAIGELMYIRARYGHGGRKGYEKEWRANPKLSGGGELIDQGVHLIDLARWFLGDFSEISGFAHTYYWEMPVEDNGFMLLKTAKKQVAFLHASCTEWKNTFSFEIYGHLGKLEINGLGGSYGVESLTFYQMLPEMGPPETIRWEYPMLDNSWEVEINNFLNDIKNQRETVANLHDAYAALITVEKIYQESKNDCYA